MLKSQSIKCVQALLLILYVIQDVRKCMRLVLLRGAR